MKQPTAYTNLSLSTGASLLGENARYLQRLLNQVADTDAMLQRLREDRYAEKQSVFDVSARDALEELPDEPLLPDRKLDIIDSMTAAQWRFTYQAVVHDEERDNWLGRSERERPDGRLDWTTALEEYRESNRADTNVIEWAADNVTATCVDGQPALDFELANGETMRVLTKQDLSGWLDDVGEVRVAWYPPKERQIIGGLTNVDPEEIEVTLGQDGGAMPREYTNPEGPDTERSATHATLLANCTDPYANPTEMTHILDVITEGYFGHAEQIKYMLFLAGERETIRVKYGYSVPFLINHLCDAVDANLTHIPQTGEVLLSRDQLSRFDHLETEFPDRQHLTDDEERAIRECLGHPQSSVDFVVQNEIAWPQVTEQLAYLFDSGSINESEIFAFQFADYMPAASEDAIFEAIRTGRDNLRAFERFDETHGTAFAEHIRHGVETYGYVIRNDW